RRDVGHLLAQLGAVLQVVDASEVLHEVLERRVRWYVRHLLPVEPDLTAVAQAVDVAFARHCALEPPRLQHHRRRSPGTRRNLITHVHLKGRRCANQRSRTARKLTNRYRCRPDRGRCGEPGKHGANSSRPVYARRAAATRRGAMILITGGMGFIGLHTTRCLLDAGEEVLLTRYRVSREPSFLREEIGRRVAVEPLDVADPESLHGLFRRYPITSVIHLAVPALRGVALSDEFRVNVQGLLNLLAAAQQRGVGRVSLASSVAVYAGLPAGPFREEQPLRLESSNSTEAFKKTFEVLGLHFADRSGLNVVALRIAGIYGPLYHSMANLPSRLVHAAVRGEAPDLAGGRGGVPHAEDTFDGCYVKDCARAIALLHLSPVLQYR